MTPEQWARSIRQQVLDQLRSKRVVYLAATGTMAQVAKRVWGSGGLTDGGTITYSEDYEVWAYKPPAPRKVSGRGKPDKQGKSRKIKGGYYPTYLAFKRDQGRGDKPFELTGQLRQDWLGGSSPSPTVVSDMLVRIEVPERTAQIIDGLSAQKGEFLVFNEAEIAGFHERVKSMIT